MSKSLRRVAWVLGSLTTSTSILASGYVSHATKTYTEMEIKAMSMGAQVQLINGLGLCLCATRKTNLIAVPVFMLTASTALFTGIIFYSKMKKDFRFNYLIPAGGAASIGGWAFMVFV
ncbi:hypothetical protein FGO68_gene11851 [Halteria grandinella]|uniref:DUF423 domain-containing protein n=1 Tax=Halteria grandinella TaxID=5974 RepID=A0A8J8T973_HALGN|nr:hypothetical protein FGO68_gene11851 [Halteria grandinella]